YETSAQGTAGEGDAKLAASTEDERGFDLVIVAGGDGTINEVIKGIAPHEHRPRVGIIPAGTTNDFARALAIPRDIKKAVNIILVENNVKPLDIVQVNDHYFVNIVGGGELTELTYEVPSKMKAAIGQLAYYIKGIEKLPSLKSISTTIEYDEQVYQCAIILFLVLNTNSFRDYKIRAPFELIDDVYFDLINLKKTNLPEFLRIASLGMRGQQIENDSIIYTQAKRIKVTPKEKMLLNIDGEFGGELPGELINLKQHIAFYVSNTFLETEAAIRSRNQALLEE